MYGVHDVGRVDRIRKALYCDGSFYKHEMPKCMDIFARGMEFFGLCFEILNWIVFTYTKCEDIR